MASIIVYQRTLLISFFECIVPTCRLLIYENQRKLFNKTSLFILGRFRKEKTPFRGMCILLSPVKGFTVRRMIECATKCLELSASCEGFIFSGNTGLCKLIGNSGTPSSGCDGDYYLVNSAREREISDLRGFLLVF